MRDMRRSPDFSAELERLSTSAWAYAALAAALETGVLDRLRRRCSESEIAAATGVELELVDDMIEALVALGVVERDGAETVPTPAFEMLSGPSISRVLRAEVRGDHLQIQHMLERVREGDDAVGWTIEDPVALAAQGETGRLIGLLVEALLPRLDGLGERMARPGARILDVGSGVGVVASELCRLWPAAEAVGLEPHRTARELGRSRIAAAGLAERIAMRDERVEMLGEIDAYDLAFLPQPFLGRESLKEGLPRVLRALRPGGWAIVLAHELPGGDHRAAAARRFRARIWGGGVLGAEELEEMLGESGFVGIRSDYPVGSFRAICARSPLDVELEGGELGAGWDTAAR